MAFRFGKKDIEKKSRVDQVKPRTSRGHALTEDTEGFQDLTWS
jgi:hypothetical protein